MTRRTAFAPSGLRSLPGGLTPDDAALALASFSYGFQREYETNVDVAAEAIRQELVQILAENPMSEVRRAITDMAANFGGPHPDDIAHLAWWRRTMSSVLTGMAVAR